MIFLSAQPDETYFHWQVEIYLYQFAKHGIANKCYALFGYRDTPSIKAIELSKKFKHVILYKDERVIPTSNPYVLTIRPHLFQKFFADYPELTSAVFYHDSDIFLVRIPRFELMLGDDKQYLSNTISYIGYNCIDACQKRYNAKYPSASEDPLIQRMCDCVGISVELVQQNEENSGGAQLLLKNIDVSFWAEAEILFQKMYDCLKAYDAKYPIQQGIQVWTAEMWVLLWLLWKRGLETRIHTDLNFSWATSTITEYHANRIFHLAGVTHVNCTGRFFKGAYHTKNVIREYARNKTIFNEINPNSATYEYVKVIKEYAENIAISEYSRFLLSSEDMWSCVYQKDPTVIILGRPLWRSVDNSYIIFNNGSVWIVTMNQDLNTITQSTGGYASTPMEEPYEGGWNHPCIITILDTLIPKPKKQSLRKMKRLLRRYAKT